MRYNTVNDIRTEFVNLLNGKCFTSVNRESTMTSIVGSKTIEIVAASFIADQDVLFGEVNHDYVNREQQWYRSMSRNVNDFPGGAPEVWKAIASSDGTVNSNYGWIIDSKENGYQFAHAIDELACNPESRRAIVVYTRPSIWKEYNVDGMSDFICTNSVQYVIRNGAVHAIVSMRSNDAHIGFKNDRHWQFACLKEVADQLNVDVGQLHWQVGSLHVYQRNFYLVDHYGKTGEVNITKAKYRELYPDSLYCP